VSTPVDRPSAQEGDLTSFHVQRAESGDVASLEWIVRRFSPLLLVQAGFRLGARLRALVEPDDLVAEVWAIALPRLRELGEREGRKTPVLLKFLTTTLLNRVNDMVRTEIVGPRGRRIGTTGGPSEPDVLGAVAADTTSVVSAILARERDELVHRALLELDDADREVIVLRAIEQNSGATVGRTLGITEKAVSMRYRRALDRLRARIPESVFDELPEP
jgi:RNA polymerase sigma factor (sigma-70 family)